MCEVVLVSNTPGLYRVGASSTQGNQTCVLYCQMSSGGQIPIHSPFGWDPVGWNNEQILMGSHKFSTSSVYTTFSQLNLSTVASLPCVVVEHLVTGSAWAEASWLHVKYILEWVFFYLMWGYFYLSINSHSTLDSVIWWHSSECNLPLGGYLLVTYLWLVSYIDAEYL